MKWTPWTAAVIGAAALVHVAEAQTTTRTTQPATSAPASQTNPTTQVADLPAEVRTATKEETAHIAFFRGVLTALEGRRKEIAAATLPYRPGALTRDLTMAQAKLKVLEAAVRGDYPEAKKVNDEALRESQRSGDIFQTPQMLARLGLYRAAAAVGSGRDRLAVARLAYLRGDVAASREFALLAIKGLQKWEGLDVNNTVRA